MSPLQALQKRFRHLKHRKSKTVTGVLHVGFAHASASEEDGVCGIPDQNAPEAEDSVLAGMTFCLTTVWETADTAPIPRTDCTCGFAKNGT
ncbi:MAG: hypothetical protein ACJZ32_03375, partial [Candidatus Poseidoniaceae archaeon]